MRLKLRPCKLPAGSGYGYRSIVERLSKKKLFTKLCHTSLWMYYIRVVHTYTQLRASFISGDRCISIRCWCRLEQWPKRWMDWTAELSGLHTHISVALSGLSMSCRGREGNIMTQTHWLAAGSFDRYCFTYPTLILHTLSTASLFHSPFTKIPIDLSRSYNGKSKHNR